MRPTLRFSLPLVAGLALFIGAGYLRVRATSRSWYEGDVQMRAELAVRGARQGLVEHWQRGDRRGVQKLISEITSDERILASVACSPDGQVFARTDDFPAAMSCRQFADGALASGAPHVWSQREQLAGERVVLSAVPVLS